MRRNVPDVDSRATGDIRRSWLRDNAVLVAAVLLPAAVALLFVVATLVPRWMVAPPQHDLVFSVEAPFESVHPAVVVDYKVEDERVVATFRGVPRPDNALQQPTPYMQRWILLLFDHRTMEVREIPAVERPAALPPGETQTVVVEALAGRRVVPGARAPDGYTVDGSGMRGSGGIVGEIFGMDRRYRRALRISRDGRAIEVEFPASVRDWYGAVHPLGWIVDGGR